MVRKEGGKSFKNAYSFWVWKWQSKGGPLVAAKIENLTFNLAESRVIRFSDIVVVVVL